MEFNLNSWPALLPQQLTNMTVQIVYVCLFCRQELYREHEEEKSCEHHPDAPVDCVHIHTEGAT